MSWYSGLNARILFDEPLARHTTLRLGPVARLWIEPFNRQSLALLVKKIKARKLTWLVIGCGSKLLITKKSLPLALHLGAGDFKACSAEDNDIVAGAGVRVSSLLKAAYDHGLGGLEFLSGIQASVGGAVMLNAGVGWPERLEIGPFVHELEVMTHNGLIKTLHRHDLEFGYRYSNLKKYIIVSARFRLFKKRKENIKIKMRKFLNHRKETQGLDGFSAGCIFKNSSGQSSGKLIDLCGLKGKHIGDAMISTKHANFIINRGNAEAKDILTLMKLMKTQVRKKFNLTLEAEIQIV